MNWFDLVLASIFSATSFVFLKRSESYTKIYPSILTFLFTILNLVFLSLALKTINMDIAYAVWCGLGTIFTATIGIIWFGESKNSLKIVSIILIILGTAIMKLT